MASATSEAQRESLGALDGIGAKAAETRLRSQGLITVALNPRASSSHPEKASGTEMLHAGKKPLSNEE